MDSNAILEIEALDYERPLSIGLTDPRITGLNGCYDLTNKKVLEIGTLDGFHAVEMALLGAYVTATDVRPQNLQRALYRALYTGMGKRIKYEYLDADDMHKEIGMNEYDLIFHSGVFYHLSDPATHLKNIAQYAQHILLETHIAEEGRHEPLFIKDQYVGWFYPEGEWKDLRAAKNNKHSFWLTRASLIKLIHDCGLQIEHVIYEHQPNPHGERVCYLLKRL